MRLLVSSRASAVAPSALTSRATSDARADPMDTPICAFFNAGASFVPAGIRCDSAVREVARVDSDRHCRAAASRTITRHRNDVAQPLVVLYNLQLLLWRRAREDDLLLGQQDVPLLLREPRDAVASHDDGSNAWVAEGDVSGVHAVGSGDLSSSWQRDDADLARDGLRCQGMVAWRQKAPMMQCMTAENGSSCDALMMIAAPPLHHSHQSPWSRG